MQSYFDFESAAPVAKIRLKNIGGNLKTIKKHAGKCKICAMVKADAYGHGLRRVAEFLEKEVDCFGVARAFEALELRNAGIKTPVLIVGALDKKNIDLLISNNITLTIMSENDVAAVAESARRLQTTANVHIKINSGMNRYGISSCEDFDRVFELCQKNNIFVEGAFTHFSTADTNSYYLLRQAAAFEKIVKGYDIPIKHCAASDAIFGGEVSLFDMVRPGISLYGYTGKRYKNVMLKPAMTVYTQLGAVYDYPAHTPIGYNCAYFTARPSKIGVAQIGYGDGIPRFKSKGNMSINGKKCKVLGNVCMDLTMLDLSGLKTVEAGVKVFYINHKNDANSVAKEAGTICYDILSSLTSRVKRIYI